MGQNQGQLGRCVIRAGNLPAAVGVFSLCMLGACSNPIGSYTDPTSENVSLNNVVRKPWRMVPDRSSRTTQFTRYDFRGLSAKGDSTVAPSNPQMPHDGTLSVFNEVNNPEQIDHPDELAQAKDEPGAKSADDLSRELSNPNSPLAKLDFKTIYTSFKGTLPGADDEYGVATIFQPAFPFPISDDGTTNLFVRPGIPMVWRQPYFDAATGSFDGVSGLGDIGFDIAIGKSFDSGVILVGGMQGTLPTGSDARLTGGQLRLGPEAVAGYINPAAYVVLFPQHQWDVAGWRDGQFSTTKLEFNSGIYLPEAWTLFTNPVFEYDWVVDQWTVPINFGVRKVTNIGGVPVQFVLKADYFVVQDDNFGRNFAVTLEITPVVANFIYNAITGN